MAAQSTVSRALQLYLAKLGPEHRELVLALDALIRKAAPHLLASLKWSNLTYHQAKNVCAITTHRHYVNLQIWQGADIPDPLGLLTGSGKTMRHIRLAAGQAFKRRAITAIVRAAARR